ncbi:hypothetical protein J6590_031673 [Homalodisca vitripennis]|nr:hypothetical protein J6590_031673 [Homalodisca vitripennis]
MTSRERLTDSSTGEVAGRTFSAEVTPETADRGREGRGRRFHGESSYATEDATPLSHALASD